ncbi:MAG: hypothetical protein JWN39_1790 [Ilumatobacteraceae bacterium]|nr:hypothetical protein [Ilumatobacteraceae bacterium]
MSSPRTEDPSDCSDAASDHSRVHLGGTQTLRKQRGSVDSRDEINVPSAAVNTGRAVFISSVRPHGHDASGSRSTCARVGGRHSDRTARTAQRRC